MINAQIKTDIKKDRFTYLRDSYDAEKCKNIKSFIDDFPNSKAEMNYGGSEKRIWMAHRYGNESIIDFVNFSNSLVSQLCKQSMAPLNVLAYSNLPVEITDNRLTKGRWHYDSFSKLFKVFLFVDDITENNGCMEIIPRTNGVFKLKKIFENNFLFHYRHIFNKQKRQAYDAISDSKIQKILDKGHKKKSLTGSQGDIVLVDTASLIHRASPCREGKRYLLACYYPKVI